MAAETVHSSFTVAQGHQPKCLTLKASNGDVIPEIGMMKPSSLDLPIEELRRRHEEDGYLWMENIINKDEVLKMRDQYFRFMTEDEDNGILAKGTDPCDGIFSGADWRDFLLPGALRVVNGIKDEGIFVEKTFKAHVADFYSDFRTNAVEPLGVFVGKLCQFKDPMLLRRGTLRCNVPGAETTPVHYDHIFLRAGPPTSITAWIPLGDYSVTGGGLMYLEDSVKIGKKFGQDFAEQGKDLTHEERISAYNKNVMAGGFWDRNAATFGKSWGRRWLITPYEVGDVVFHNPYMIHASCRNESEERVIRLSTDLRFVDQVEPFDQRWLFDAYQQNDPNVASRQKKSHM